MVMGCEAPRAELSWLGNSPGLGCRKMYSRACFSSTRPNCGGGRLQKERRRGEW